MANKGEYILLRANNQIMALNEEEQIQDAAEKRQETTETQDSTILARLSGLINKTKLAAGLAALIATPAVAGGCATEPQVVKAPEETVDTEMKANIIQYPNLGMIGVSVESNLNEPLSETKFALLGAQNNLIDTIEHPIQVDGDSVKFVETEHARDNEIPVDNAAETRFIVVTGRDARGNLISRQLTINGAALDDTDPFINE